MKASPERLGLIHFIGIGGIGMSGIAKILHVMGYHVQGSDMSKNFQTQTLQDQGVRIFDCHAPQNLAGVRLVVISTAVRPDNVELIEARRLGIPVIRRAEMLGELMRLKNSIAISGTHGKTTTTSLVGSLLEQTHLDPTVVNGGIINAYGSNARAGRGSWIVVEADESDGSFSHLQGTIVAVTNINPEHMDHYHSIEVLHDSFRKFVESIPFYGLAVLCWDHPQVRALAHTVSDRRVVTYGLEEGAQIQAQNLEPSLEGVTFQVRLERSLVPTSWHTHPQVEVGPDHVLIQGFSTPMVGQHNVQNGLVAVAVACELGIDLDVLLHTFQTFQGVKRRFSIVGGFQGVTIVDDYAHHPVEIQAVLKAARQRHPQTRLMVVWQPHRYSRVKHLLDDFIHVLREADHTIILPVYAAGEDAVPELTPEVLKEKLSQAGAPSVSVAHGTLGVAETLYALIQPGDTVLCMGAGDITYYAAQLPEALAELHRMQADPSHASLDAAS